MPRSKVVKPASGSVVPKVRRCAKGKFIKNVDLSTAVNNDQNKKCDQSDPSDKPSKPKRAGAAHHWLVTVPFHGDVIAPSGRVPCGTDGTTVVPGGEVILSPPPSACVHMPPTNPLPNMEGTHGVVPMVPMVPHQNRLECHVIREWVMDHCHDASWQLERAPTTGYLHWQLYIHCKKGVRLTWLKAHLNAQAHYELCKAIDKSNAYCFKPETRVEGPYHWPEPAEASAVKDPLEGLTLRPWQQQVVDCISGPISNESGASIRSHQCMCRAPCTGPIVTTKQRLETPTL